MWAAGDLCSCSRRSFLALLPAACFAAGKNVIPSAAFRYSDPSTEFPVLRLTDPAYTSRLPAHYQRALTRHANYLLYTSDFSGRVQAYRMDLKNGVSQPLTDEEGIQPSSVTFTADERSLCYVAGGALVVLNIGSSRARTVYRVPEGFEAAALSLAEDSLYAALIERKGVLHRLRLIRMADGLAATLAEAAEEMGDPIPRPRRASILYRRGKGLWLANYDGQRNSALRLAEGSAGSAMWSPDGRSVFYLNYPDDERRLHNIRESVPDSNEDRPVADTTQYVSCERNPDATVFTGASGSKASPHVLLLVRTVRREMTLCEHRASDPAMVSPIFAPNSQHIYFVSDQHGKPAIYSMAVEKFVTETDSTN